MEQDPEINLTGSFWWGVRHFVERLCALRAASTPATDESGWFLCQSGNCHMFVILKKCQKIACSNEKFKKKLCYVRKFEHNFPQTFHSNCLFSASSLSIDERWDLYDSSIMAILDKLAPVRSKTYQVRPSNAWFDNNCIAAKRLTRLYEGSYIKSFSPADRVTKLYLTTSLSQPLSS